MIARDAKDDGVWSSDAKLMPLMLMAPVKVDAAFTGEAREIVTCA